MNPLSFNITLFSTALFSTWIFVEELGLLFDAGDGVSAGLMQKGRKVKSVFLTHPDRDHLGGLLQFCQLNSRPALPHFYYPNDCKSFEYLQAFMARFDKHTADSLWTGIQDKSIVSISTQLDIEAIRNEHIPVPQGVHKSLSYLLWSKKRKLKDEFKQLSNKEIAHLSLQKGQDFISSIQKQKLIGISGDCPVRDYEHWNNLPLLIHEATFLAAEPGLNSKKNKHSTLPEVMDMVSNLNIQCLILKHFSSRYSAEQIKAAIRKACKSYKIQIPVYAVMPGQIARNILKGQAINA